MTASAPTAMEQATIDRLGIFDEEKFAEIVENEDGVPCSAVECDRAAEWRILCAHCRALMGALCTPCDQDRAVTGIISGFRCPACQARTIDWVQATKRVPL